MWPSDVSVLIPSYKSADRLTTFLPGLLNTVPCENVVIVDDASGDGTDMVCSRFSITYLRHELNQGKGAALATGFGHLVSRGCNWIVTMDADGQHAVQDLDKFLECRSKDPGVGICIGAREMKPGVMPLPRICSNLITSGILTLLSGVRIRDGQCGYRLYSARLVESIAIEFRRFEMESEVILKAAHLGLPVRFVEVQTLYLDGFSHISHLHDTIRWIKAVLSVWLALRKNDGGPDKSGTADNLTIEHHEY